ncbi:ganglioside GM2 activator-like [Haliotis rubra]|uniref:ganglioside GM2 activator-like n=1 Tax=Haliotis rubra TaxID=36100 RepID=UPI001EE5A588|nr:ganglioside GM2 activator-like [Haliotis rubra]
MKYCSSVVAFAFLAVGVAFAAVLHYDPLKITSRLESEMEDLMQLVMKPHTLSRYIPLEVYKKMGLNPSTRLTDYRWKNCGNPSMENLIINDIKFSPDPISLAGTLTVSFSINLKVTVASQLKGVVLLEKQVAGSWIELPCIGNIGSCTYDDICPLLSQIGQCPPEFNAAGIPCKCPLNAGNYTLPGASFEIDASFLPSGDYHIRANLTHGAVDGGCYDIYASFA